MAMLKRSRLTTKEKRYLQDIGGEVMDLRHDWERRFRNAVLSLALNDPRWMMFIQREVKPDEMDLKEMTRLVEARARLIMLKPYNYFGRSCVGSYIFRDDWPFTDRGSLSPG